MLKLSLDKDYKAAIYLRLSKEDGDFSISGEKLESDSISNQRMLIKEYLKKHPEITVVKEYCDDGFTGANFERPDFNRMMEAVRAGLVDCIVVKDLSRFGREYIEAGKDQKGKGFDPRKLLAPGAEAIKATVKEKMELFGSVGKA